MEEESNVKQLILDSRKAIQNAVDGYLNYENFLLYMDKSEKYITKYGKLWKYAFENFSNWENVVEKFTTKTVEKFENPNRQKNPNKSIKISKTEYKIIEEADIVVEFYDQQVYGKHFFYL